VAKSGAHRAAASGAATPARRRRRPRLGAGGHDLGRACSACRRTRCVSFLWRYSVPHRRLGHRILFARAQIREWLSNRIEERVWIDLYRNPNATEAYWVRAHRAAGPLNAFARRRCNSRASTISGGRSCDLQGRCLIVTVRARCDDAGGRRNLSRCRRTLRCRPPDLSPRSGHLLRVRGAASRSEPAWHGGGRRREARWPRRGDFGELRGPRVQRALGCRSARHRNARPPTPSSSPATTRPTVTTPRARQVVERYSPALGRSDITPLHGWSPLNSLRVAAA
jgi:hypothetical protein